MKVKQQDQNLVMQQHAFSDGYPLEQVSTTKKSLPEDVLKSPVIK